MITLRKPLDDETFVGDIVDRAWNARNDVWVWDGDDLDDRPQAGDAAGFGLWAMRPAARVTDPDGVLPRYLMLRVTEWGDYVGSDVRRSNYRSLLRDFPDTFVDGWDDYGYRVLMLPLLGVIPMHLADALVGLVDKHPLYDEEDHSELESEIEQEDVKSFIVDDLRRDVATGLYGAEPHDDECAVPSDESLEERYWQARQDDEVSWQAETAISGRPIDLERLAATIVTETRGIAASTRPKRLGSCCAALDLV